MIKYLIEKEFKQISRNPFLPRLIMFYPLIVLLIFPWAATYEIRNINLCVVDNDHSTYSQQLVEKAVSSGYFRLTAIEPTYQQAMQQIESKKANVILEIPPYFKRDLINKQSADVLIASNAVNGSVGGLSSQYMVDIVNSYAAGIRKKWAQTGQTASTQPTIEVVSQNRFNPFLNYKFYMIPAMMVMVLTIMTGFLPALNIVSEKEAGTMEQINVTPVPKFTFIFSKLLSYWIIGFFVISISFLVAWIVYGFVPTGYLSTMYAFAGIYILAVSGMGLIISNYSDTMQQALFVIFFFMIVLILLSGLFTPVNSMPEWAQWIAAFNPLKYFIEVMRSVYLKGSQFSDLLPQFFALIGFATFFNAWAIMSYRKNN
ncbi:ABC-2 transporter permease [Microbacter margulisiae]|uniref:ABC-2 type transport system permease protein n=1 Tax=Microbacter margulisiae TaxID=1350067 RepID=A0A7W5DSB5_9PORP|nr:ABC transporter permease [Microbacter margulisiae]MBB3188152.1 ABC-2 type transport system permease protein [Microbacter margulisiae]